MAEIDFGGSPATPYFGDEGRQDKTEQAREAAGDEVDADRPTGVDRTGPAARERDEFGREIVPPQFVPSDQVAESAEPKDTVPPVEGDVAPEDAATHVDPGQESKAEDFDTQSKNAVETGQSQRNPYEQAPNPDTGVVEEQEGGFFTDAEVVNEEGGEGGPRPASSWK